LTTTALTGLPLLATLLAFAPGGLEVMTILAFALGVNPAFVATHQLVRFVSLNLSMPFASQLFLTRDDK
ncbi:MAG: AbrB family transcriptional regulator, partial [Hyphomicrobiales bacterium]|nr:AbrB family transcriptional regulator [Hyphomicrobiales bacterium]